MRTQKLVSEKSASELSAVHQSCRCPSNLDALCDLAIRVIVLRLNAPVPGSLQLV